ncbi:MULTISPECIES: hypothetical protein [Helicobacter]|uniref:hypothetical protein n=1 Tax=Helicobacter TaxID=209 RepID=UPI000EB1EED8|nr:MULTISPECIES: hypothetical protein [Helicobacter]
MFKTKFPIGLVLAWLGFYLYSNIADIYTWLPPMLAFLFAFYRHTLENPRAEVLWWIFACLVSVELIYTQPLGVLILLFIFYEKLVVRNLLRAFQDNVLGDLVHGFCVYGLYLGFLALWNHNYAPFWKEALSYSVLEFLLWRVYARV